LFVHVLQHLCPRLTPRSAQGLKRRTGNVMDQLQNTQPRHHFVPATTTTSSYSKNLLCDLYDGRKHNQTNTNFSQTQTF
jgi:hypothetical protein